MTIIDIKSDKFPIIIFTDSHLCIDKIRQLKSLYPHNQLISLGDAVDLYCKDERNKTILQHLIDNNIPHISGNHEEHISGVVNGTTITFLDNVHSIDINYYKLPKHQCKYLQTLSRGIKLTLPNKRYYLLYHHLPKDVWSFKDAGSLSKEEFINAYELDDKCIDVIHGHTHKNFIDGYYGLNTRRISLGALKYGWYGIINEDGFVLKQL